MMNIGFIGLGNMGLPIARNLLRADFGVWAYDLNPLKSVQLAAGSPHVLVAPTLADTVEPGGIVLSMVPDDNALMDIALRKNGVLSRLGRGGIHLSLSTVSPASAQLLADRYREQGATYISATVLGRPDVAAEAQLSVFLSGEEQAKVRVLPLLEVLGRVEDLGTEVALANVAKLSANALILAAIAAMGEVAEFIERQGGDPAHILPLIASSALFRGSKVYEGYGKMIGSKDFSEALFPLGLGLKDAKLILEAAQRIRLHMPSIRHAYNAILKALAAGRDAEDWSVLSLYSFSSQESIAAD
jgi:3-hydroxyisobutyrate dehydrogenase-like beta-hydroxyacid dehydrogenase